MISVEYIDYMDYIDLLSRTSRNYRLYRNRIIHYNEGMVYKLEEL